MNQISAKLREIADEVEHLPDQDVILFGDSTGFGDSGFKVWTLVIADHAILKPLPYSRREQPNG